MMVSSVSILKDVVLLLCCGNMVDHCRYGRGLLLFDGRLDVGCGRDCRFRDGGGMDLLGCHWLYSQISLERLGYSEEVGRCNLIEA